MKETYEAIVIGAGHAGCEAALALARKKHKTLLLTISLDALAFLACNPSIGGTAKGQLVSEIDALGGQMGLAADKTAIQIRMLNRGRGPAVQSLRAQEDKNEYHAEMKKVVENTPNLFLKQGEVESVKLENGKKIIKTAVGDEFEADVVVFATGVYLDSRIIIGKYTESVGPNGFKNAKNLSKSLKKLGYELYRFKTGTPARVNARSVNFDELEIQKGEENIQTFSFMTNKRIKNKACCYLTYTNKKTHEIIRNNLDKAPAISGEIVGVGPRYCPSIETKIVRFADKDRHQLFLEPESLSTAEVYIQGFSTSMPTDIQEKMVHSVKGLENAEIMRDSYAIEYDCINPQQLKLSLESKLHDGLFFAGQINGTSGYEEAAAQGLIAGINAALKLENKEPLILSRCDAYIGVLIDDIVTKGTNEPYRMMTSRAEYRLSLRQDNADLRLTQIGRDVGLVDDKRYRKFLKKKMALEKVYKNLDEKIKISEKLKKFFENNKENPPKNSISIKDMIKRSNLDLIKISKEFGLFSEMEEDILNEINLIVKFEGYLKQQQEDIEKAKKAEQIKIPEDFVYEKQKGLKIETIQKLSQIKPENLGQASRVSGVSPADIAVLSVLIKKHQGEKNERKN